ncbi:hypothetical protein D3C71_1527880 [compost metagenome]
MMPKIPAVSITRLRRMLCRLSRTKVEKRLPTRPMVPQRVSTSAVQMRLQTSMKARNGVLRRKKR